MAASELVLVLALWVTLMVARAAGKIGAAPARSNDKRLPRTVRSPKGQPLFAMCADSILPRDYFFSHAMIATMMPITLRIDINPAGMNALVRMNFEAK